MVLVKLEIQNTEQETEIHPECDSCPSFTHSFTRRSKFELQVHLACSWNVGGNQKTTAENTTAPI